MTDEFTNAEKVKTESESERVRGKKCDSPGCSLVKGHKQRCDWLGIERGYGHPEPAQNDDT